MPCAVIPQTTLTHCSRKTSTFAPFVVEICVYNSTLRVALLLLLEHKHNSHMTIGIEHCKRLPPYSVRDSIRTEISDSQVPNVYGWRVQVCVCKCKVDRCSECRERMRGDCVTDRQTDRQRQREREREIDI